MPTPIRGQCIGCAVICGGVGQGLDGEERIDRPVALFTSATWAAPVTVTAAVAVLVGLPNAIIYRGDGAVPSSADVHPHRRGGVPCHCWSSVATVSVPPELTSWTIPVPVFSAVCPRFALACAAPLVEVALATAEMSIVAPLALSKSAAAKSVPDDPLVDTPVDAGVGIGRAGGDGQRIGPDRQRTAVVDRRPCRVRNAADLHRRTGSIPIVNRRIDVGIRSGRNLIVDPGRCRNVDRGASSLLTIETLPAPS